MDRRPRHAALASLLAVLTALGGCAVGPNFTRPEAPVPAEWNVNRDARATAQAATDSLWWKTFADPTLDRLVELAYHQNLPLQIASLRIVEARAQVAVATGRYFPQTQIAFASAEAIGISKNTPLGANLPTRHFGDYQLGFDAAWELDFWGKYRRGVESETAGLMASMADYYQALVSLTAEVARTDVLVRTFEVLIQQAQ